MSTAGDDVKPGRERSRAGAVVMWYIETMRSWLLIWVCLAGLVACGSSGDTPASDFAGMGSAGGAGGSGGEAPACEVLGLPELQLDATGPFGLLRHDLAADFAVPLTDGSVWQLSDHYSGCESYVFIPSGRVSSSLDATSIWERDLEGLIGEHAPRNAHYFFVATRSVEEAHGEIAAMQERVEAALAALGEADRSWWSDRLHVVTRHRSNLAGWLGPMLDGQGAIGFAIDRQQRIRLLGILADVHRYRAELEAAGEWPFEENMAYARYEVDHYNYEARREEHLAAQPDVTIITPWEGDVLAEVVETTVDFPSAEVMAGFDTLEIDLTMDCADPTQGELGNCGPWDYLSHIYLLDEDSQSWLELARFITPFHRAGRYLVDATPLLVQLREGGPRQLRFEASPPWNPQAYLTRMQLRFSNQGKGLSPAEATFLFAGGPFSSTYNDAYQPIDVPISAGAQKVELWALITGHGAEAYSCAEFCDHQHELTVNGVSHTKRHEEVDDPEACIGHLETGVVPNQGGDWWYGRGGWCPGEQVDPWVVDVTGDVTPGQTATVSYRGLLSGQAPPDNAGSIRMTSYLVVYE